VVLMVVCVRVDAVQRCGIAYPEAHARAVRQPQPLACMSATAVCDDHLARRNMRAHGTAEGLDICQCEASVPKSGGLADQLLWMACPTEKRMVADDGEFAPAMTASTVR
jgi:hypothetical protein